jgi:hypothetical protein
MTDKSVVVIGLPGAGKTTYLAALWHLVTANDIATKLKLSRLGAGSRKHLNDIASRWQNATQQDRTFLQGLKLVQMHLSDDQGRDIRVTFPDVPGEEYRRMWEDREIDADVQQTLNSHGVAFFIHADKINQPNWVVDEAAMLKLLRLPAVTGQPVEWHPQFAPTQVQVVDILQMLRSSPLDIGPRRLAIILSVWDKAADEGLAPEAYLAQKMPLLNQYLSRNADDWDVRIYGVSAQGGDYDDANPATERSEDAKRLRDLDNASTRIDVVSNIDHTHDLTAPLAWLME